MFGKRTKSTELQRAEQLALQQVLESASEMTFPGDVITPGAVAGAARMLGMQVVQSAVEGGATPRDCAQLVELYSRVGKRAAQMFAPRGPMYGATSPTLDERSNIAGDQPQATEPDVSIGHIELELRPSDEAWTHWYFPEEDTRDEWAVFAAVSWAVHASTRIAERHGNPAGESWRRKVAEYDSWQDLANTVSKVTSQANSGAELGIDWDLEAEAPLLQWHEHGPFGADLSKRALVVLWYDADQRGFSDIVRLALQLWATTECDLAAEAEPRRRIMPPLLVEHAFKGHAERQAAVHEVVEADTLDVLQAAGERAASELDDPDLDITERMQILRRHLTHRSAGDLAQEIEELHSDAAPATSLVAALQSEGIEAPDTVVTLGDVRRYLAWTSERWPMVSTSLMGSALDDMMAWAAGLPPNDEDGK